MRRTHLGPLVLALAALLPALPAAARTLEDIEPKQRAELLKRARAYFDTSLDAWKVRKDMRLIVEELAGGGADLLTDLDLLQETLYQGRMFLPEFDDKDWQRANDVTGFSVSGPYRNLLSERMRFTFAVPETYPKAAVLAKLPRGRPYPAIFSLHEEQDYKADEKHHAGESALKRRFPKTECSILYKDWLMLAPVTPRAQFVKEDGSIREDFVTNILAQLWRRYHVDFDRIVLDGADAAMALASAQPNFFAGLVLWGGKPDPDTIRNYASLPVFVVNNEGLKYALEDGGHKDVTLGAPDVLPDWLARRHRESPRKFSWNAKRRDQELAYWIYLGGLDMGSAARSIEVEVSDDNRIDIRARGVEHLTLYLNDRIVDLSKAVRVSVNGVETDLGVLERKFDEVFPTKEGMNFRKSMYLGWLYPVRLEGVVVPAPDGAGSGGAGTPPAPPGGGATSATPPKEVDPQAEEKAQKYWSKAEEALAAGDDAKARGLYEKIVGLGATSMRVQAEARLAEIDAK